MPSQFARNIPAQTGAIDIGAWEVDEDHEIFPVGSKPKRMVVCPDNPAQGECLIPKHSYLFKVAHGRWEQQLWTEIVAYRLGHALGVEVPPCFYAVDSKRDEEGALVEFFFGYPDEERPAQFMHASDILTRVLQDKKRGRPHALRNNIRVCSALGVAGPVEWWAKTVVFDALIGNTDRHPENWGFLVHKRPRERTEYQFAPAFDNGTSLAYGQQETKIASLLEEDRLERYIQRGKHHCSWVLTPDEPGQHIELCVQFAKAYPEAGPLMRNMIRFDDVLVESILRGCRDLAGAVPFSQERAQLLHALIINRRDRLRAALEGVQ
jgi:hypothetical protein